MFGQFRVSEWLLCAAPPAYSCPCSSRGPGRCICPLPAVSMGVMQAHMSLHTVAERIDRDEHVSDICLRPWSVGVLVCGCLSLRRGVGASGSTHVYLAILESLLQVVVDGLVGDLADQGQVGDSDFLLLGRLEDGLCCELGLGGCPCGGLATNGLARCAVGLPLHAAYISLVSWCRAALAGYHG
jgi:hypothetical protein